MKKLPKPYSLGKGFSLIELLVVITILIVLLALTLTVLNPFTQLKKFRDAQRKQDFFQIRNSLDAYYNDHSCYPLTIPFGEEWSDGNVVLMKKVPKDPSIKCITGSCYEYFYQTDGGACPQWAILYTKLEIDPKKNNCGTQIIKKMCPGNRFSPKFNYCLAVGQIDCASLQAADLPSPYTSSTTLTTVPATSTTVSTTTTVPSICPLGTYYACTGALTTCNRLDDDPGNLCEVHGGSYVCYCESDCRGCPVN